MASCSLPAGVHEKKRQQRLCSRPTVNLALIAGACEKSFLTPDEHLLKCDSRRQEEETVFKSFKLVKIQRFTLAAFN